MEFRSRAFADQAVRSSLQEKCTSFRSASLPLYGLSSTYLGRRNLGDCESMADRVISLSLVHGDPASTAGIYLEVFTDDLWFIIQHSGLTAFTEPNLAAYDVYRHTLLDLLSAKTGIPDLEWSLHKPPNWAEKAQALVQAFGPLAHVWIMVEIDDEPVLFGGLQAGEVGAVRTIYRGYGLTLFWVRWPFEGLQLERIHDVGPYVEGSKLGLPPSFR